MEDTLRLLIPVIVLTIPLAGVVFWGVQQILRLRLEDARARAEAGGGVSDPELNALRAEVGELRSEIGEIQERLDFTERVLIQNREHQRLPADGKHV